MGLPSIFIRAVGLVACLVLAAVGQDVANSLMDEPGDAARWSQVAKMADLRAAMSIAQRVLAKHDGCRAGWETLGGLALRDGDYPLGVRAWGRSAALAEAASDWPAAWQAHKCLFELHRRAGAVGAAVTALENYRAVRVKAGKTTDAVDRLLQPARDARDLTPAAIREKSRKLASEARAQSDSGAERSALLSLSLSFDGSSDVAELREALDACRRVLELDKKLGLPANLVANDENACGRFAVETALRLDAGPARSALLDEALAHATAACTGHSAATSRPDREIVRDHCLLAHVHDARGDLAQAEPHYREEFSLVSKSRSGIAGARSASDDPLDMALRSFDGEVHHIYEDFGLFLARGGAGRAPDVVQALAVTEVGRAGVLTELFRIRGRAQPVWVGNPVDVQRVADAARSSDATILVFVAGSHRGGVISIGSRGVTFADLGALDRIDSIAAPFVRAIGSLASSRAELDAGGRAVFDALIGPVWESCRGSRRLVIAGFGRWNEVPLAALVVPGEGTTNERYLGALRELVFVPTLGCLLATQPEAESGEPMAVGFPGGAGYDAGLAAHFGIGRLAPLAFATREATAFTKTLGGHTLTDAAATEASVRRAMPGASHVHFACHAVVDRTNGARTALLLSPDAARGDDGFLTLPEILGLETRARLVSVLACSSAFGTPIAGESVRGLARCFLVAGARFVLASVAPVDDRAAPRFFEAFTIALKSGESIPGGVRTAQRSMIATKATSHPALWAPIALFGRDLGAVRDR